MDGTKQFQRLWIGGSSGLTETYFNTFPHDEGWILLGAESEGPSWIPPGSRFWCADLLQPEQVDQILARLKGYKITHLVLSLRPPLVSHRTDSESWECNSMLLSGLQRLLEVVCTSDDDTPKTFVHISSIAAIDHIARQHLRKETDPDPVSGDLRYPYDRFKRRSEELVALMCTDKPRIRWTNLRTGALFSDNKGCIQCSSLQLSSRTGPYLRQAIDCNSSRNVCHLIRIILMQQHTDKPLQPAYFYTRPLHLDKPRPYGDYLLAYQKAHDIRICLWMPVLVIVLLRGVLGVGARLLGRWISYLESLNYLLQVTLHEHTFDNALVKSDFPQLEAMEETIEACFRRRRQHLLRFALEHQRVCGKKEV